MKNLNKKNTETTKLSTPNKVKKGFRFYCVAVLALTFVLGSSVTALLPETTRLPWSTTFPILSSVLSVRSV